VTDATHYTWVIHRFTTLYIIARYISDDCAGTDNIHDRCIIRTQYTNVGWAYTIIYAPTPDDIKIYVPRVKKADC